MDQDEQRESKRERKRQTDAEGPAVSQQRQERERERERGESPALPGLPRSAVSSASLRVSPSSPLIFPKLWKQQQVQEQQREREGEGDRRLGERFERDERELMS